ncbi:hypothetical protein BDV24DRAFT_146355, partial [Aspergillus arachidicola]
MSCIGHSQCAPIIQAAKSSKPCNGIRTVVSTIVSRKFESYTNLAYGLWRCLALKVDT